MPEVKNGIKKEGLARAQKLIQEELDQHKNVTINIAVIGRVGVGKSNFINTIRG
jgi:predicted GTPase